jgi:hypothetical protein
MSDILIDSRFLPLPKNFPKSPIVIRAFEREEFSASPVDDVCRAIKLLEDFNFSQVLAPGHLAALPSQLSTLEQSLISTFVSRDMFRLVAQLALPTEGEFVTASQLVPPSSEQLTLEIGGDFSPSKRLTDIWISSLSALAREAGRIARVETTHVYILAAVANMKQNQAAVFISRINPTERENVIRIFSKKREWPGEASEGIGHYIKALHTLTENRNMLIHGNIVDMWAVKAPGVISMNREGLTTIIQLSLPAIRQVADDLHTDGEFGYMLACYLASEFSQAALEAGTAAPSHCPPLPALPKPLRPPQPKKPVAQA